MKVHTRDMGKVTILDVIGKITIGKGDLILREAIDNCVKDGKTRILLNLTGVTYMDSAGIGELVACFKRVTGAEGIMKLVNPAGRVQDLLALTKLDEYFETYLSEPEALASFAACR